MPEEERLTQLASQGDRAALAELIKLATRHNDRSMLERTKGIELMSLGQYVERRQCLPNRALRAIMYGVLNTLEPLHSNNQVHGNINPWSMDLVLRRSTFCGVYFSPVARLSPEAAERARPYLYQEDGWNSIGWGGELRSPAQGTAWDVWSLAATLLVLARGEPRDDDGKGPLDWELFVGEKRPLRLLGDTHFDVAWFVNRVMLAHASEGPAMTHARESLRALKRLAQNMERPS